MSRVLNLNTYIHHLPANPKINYAPTLIIFAPMQLQSYAGQRPFWSMKTGFAQFLNPHML